MAYKNIKVDRKENVGFIKIDRPNSLNALNRDTLLEMSNAVSDFESNSKIKAVIITGQGKAFIAGADIKQMKDMNSLEAKEFSELGHSLLMKIEKSRLAFIASVNGYALGGGCEVMMACDISIASDKAIFGQPEINLGIHPGFGGTQRLPRLIGKNRAKQLLLTGDNINAEEAKKIGLINIVVQHDKLKEETEKIAQKIAAKSAIQIDFIKALVNKGSDIDLHSACALEITYFSTSFSTIDQKEGMNAFLEKKKPNFKNK